MHSQIHDFLNSKSHFQNHDPLRVQSVPVALSKDTAALEPTPITLPPGLAGKAGLPEIVQPADDTMRETADGRTGVNEVVDSISAYVDKCVEELRAEDYSAGRKPSISPTVAKFPRFYPSQAFAWASTPGHPFSFPHSGDSSSIGARGVSALPSSTSFGVAPRTMVMTTSKAPKCPTMLGTPLDLDRQLCTCGSCKALASKTSPHPDILSRHGTQTLAFAVTPATDTRAAPSGALFTANLLFNTITGMPGYANESLEELRLEDYALSGKLRSRSLGDERSGSPPVRSALSPSENPVGASQSPVYQASKSTTAPESTADGALKLLQVAGGDDNVDVKSPIAVSDTIPTAPSSPVYPHYTPDEHATDTSSPPDGPLPLTEVPPSGSPVVEQRPPSDLDDYGSHSLCIRRLDAEIKARVAEELLRRAAQARVVKLEGELRRMSAEVARLHDVEKRLAIHDASGISGQSQREMVDVARTAKE